MEKAYERYKDSGFEWFRNIPSEWQIVSFKYLINKIYTGGTPTTSNSNYWVDKGQGIPWVAISDITKSNKFLLDTKKEISEDGRASKGLDILPKGTLLLSIFASLGKTVRLGVEATVNQAILGLETNEKLSVDFLEYLFIDAERYISYYSSMSTQENLNLSKIRSLNFPIPPKEQQTQIAAYLDYHTQLIDTLISKKETLIQKLQEQRQAIINEAVTKGLNKNVALKDSGIEWLGEIPEHWEVSRLDYLSEIIDPQPDHRAPKMDLNGLPYLGIRDIKDDGTINVNTARIVELAAIEKQERSFTIEEGDIVFGKVGTLANPKHIKLGGERVALSATLVLIKSENLMNRFLKYVLDSNYIWYQINTVIVGATRPALGITQIRKFRILKPYNNINELEVIVNYLDTETSKIHNAIKKLTSSIQKLKDYRQSLISEAVTGKIDVRDWQQPKNKS
ncbi:restriction endonuclease subunit S [Tenacibaculum maritimum]|uniref:restriction endonuclease subunit S n=1 Tax=Tenacibaculum maritimum TaxID=107401 RepID=UPI00387709FF